MTEPDRVKVTTHRALTTEEQVTIAFLASLLPIHTLYAAFSRPTHAQ